MKISAAIIASLISISMVTPIYARGGGFHGSFGGSGFHGGGFHNEGFGSAFHGEGGLRGGHGFPGGFDSIARPNTGAQSDFGGFANHNQAFQNFDRSGLSHFPTDNGFGNLSSFRPNSADNFHQFNPQNANWHNNDIRNSFNQYNQANFNRYGGYGYGWHGPYGGYGAWGYPGAWGVPGWTAATAWTGIGLGALGSFLGIADLAALSGNNNGEGGNDSMNNIEIDGPNVYVNGQPSGTETDLYQQSYGLAQSGIQNNNCDQDTAANDWRSLGVFSLAQPGQTESSMLFELAINKDGSVRGNYFNQLTNETQEIYGSLNKQTQKVAFTLGKNASTVFDTSLADLTKDEAPVLVHYGPDSTQGMMLVRVNQPVST